MTKKDSGYYLVKEDILPSAIKKTIKVKEMLRRHDNMTINDAVSKMGLSRSAYYKYKDFVLPFYEASINKIVSVSFVLDNKQGVLSNVLNMISEDKGNVLTINQGIPLQGVAVATISIETKNMNIDLEALLIQHRELNNRCPQQLISILDLDKSTALLVFAFPADPFRLILIQKAIVSVQNLPDSHICIFPQVSILYGRYCGISRASKDFQQYKSHNYGSDNTSANDSNLL